MRLLIHLGEGFAGVGGELQMRIAVNDFLEGFPRFIVLVQIILIYLADGEQGVEAILAAGILTAQELVLRDGGAQGLLIVEGAAAFGEQLGDGHHAGIRLAAAGRGVVDAAVGIHDALVLAARTFMLRQAVELFAHSLGVFKLRARLLLLDLNIWRRRRAKPAGTAGKTPSARASIRAYRFVPSSTASSLKLALAKLVRVGEYQSATFIAADLNGDRQTAEAQAQSRYP